ncbi:hypothetical protein AMAG_19673 [Allomyces macrogynus ATCC 38327]|uniref:Uncharacterized protein n=1 Tax=Allomyces macrogynus (strain ATCC 38327) TaxID=578462 RepID=A0A0L0SXY1_ALLM3|nr:hypothetical protein AMAG_19673 [Allomyces macrogynus ATCC 38327]|eukprot:KNE67255.1 hypothetical protein AMAG_19673 [Allomyces macrogynus ATCC 38327]
MYLDDDSGNLADHGALHVDERANNVLDDAEALTRMIHAAATAGAGNRNSLQDAVERVLSDLPADEDPATLLSKVNALELAMKSVKEALLKNEGHGPTDARTHDDNDGGGGMREDVPMPWRRSAPVSPARRSRTIDRGHRPADLSSTSLRRSSSRLARLRSDHLSLGTPSPRHSAFDPDDSGLASSDVAMRSGGPPLPPPTDLNELPPPPSPAVEAFLSGIITSHAPSTPIAAQELQMPEDDVDVRFTRISRALESLIMDAKSVLSSPTPADMDADPAVLPTPPTSASPTRPIPGPLSSRFPTSPLANVTIPNTTTDDDDDINAAAPPTTINNNNNDVLTTDEQFTVLSGPSILSRQSGPLRTAPRPTTRSVLSGLNPAPVPMPAMPPMRPMTYTSFTSSYVPEPMTDERGTNDDEGLMAMPRATGTSGSGSGSGSSASARAPLYDPETGLRIRRSILPSAGSGVGYRRSPTAFDPYAGPPSPVSYTRRIQRPLSPLQRTRGGGGARSMLSGYGAFPDDFDARSDFSITPSESPSGYFRVAPTPQAMPMYPPVAPQPSPIFQDGFSAVGVPFNPATGAPPTPRSIARYSDTPSWVAARPPVMVAPTARYASPRPPASDVGSFIGRRSNLGPRGQQQYGDNDDDEINGDRAAAVAALRVPQHMVPTSHGSRAGTSTGTSTTHSTRDRDRNDRVMDPRSPPKLDNDTTTNDSGAFMWSAFLLVSLFMGFRGIWRWIAELAEDIVDLLVNGGSSSTTTTTVAVPKKPKTVGAAGNKRSKQQHRGSVSNEPGSGKGKSSGSGNGKRRTSKRASAAMRPIA